MLSDLEIQERAVCEDMISPFVDEQIREVDGRPVISYGLSSYGYDFRVGNDFKVIYANPDTQDYRHLVIDPKRIDTIAFKDVKCPDHAAVAIPPHGFVLATTVERFKIPRDVLVTVLGKSTYARCGLILNVTPLEPCFSDDTEILTVNGWQLLSAVGVGDVVLGMREGGIAEWQPVERKQVYSYQGDMIHIEGRSVDMLVTPEHKLLVRRRTNGRCTRRKQEKTDWHTVLASDVYGAWNYEVTRRVTWEGEACDSEIQIGSLKLPTHTFLEFLGVYLGDGSAHKAKGGYLIKLGALKERKRQNYARILTSLGVRWRFTERGLQFFSRDLYYVVKPLGHAPDKYIPFEYKNMSPVYLSSLLAGLIASDGNSETGTYTTCSQQLADDVQEVIFKCGGAAIVRCVGIPPGGNYPCYKVRLCYDHLDPKINPKTHSKVPYNGLVYDVTVPGHVVFVRRNGKPVWSGNCWEGQVTLEISNTTDFPALVYAGEGIGQAIFHTATPDRICAVSYADRKGKYQNQKGIVLPKV